MKVHLEAKIGCRPGAGSRRREQLPRALGVAGAEPQSRERLARAGQAQQRGLLLRSSTVTGPGAGARPGQRSGCQGWLPAGALEGHLGVPAEETGGAWVVVGGRGRPGRSGPGSSAHGVRSCLGARRPEWTCPRLETGPTSPGAAPPRPPAGHSGWSCQPQEVLKPTPWPAAGQAGPAGNSGARGLSVRSPAAGHPRLLLLALRPLVRPSPCPSALGSG